MILKKTSFLFLLCCVSVLSGCASVAVGAYSDPEISQVRPQDLRKEQQTLPLQLELEWQLNGHAPSKQKEFMEIPVPSPDMQKLRSDVELAFKKSGVIEIVNTGGLGTIKVSLNDVSDIGDAIDKGTQLGRTWGDDYITTKQEYELSLYIRSNGIVASPPASRGAYFSVVAKSKLPADPRIRSPKLVFDEVLEQMVLKNLIEMQRNGDLEKLRRASY